MTEHDWPDPDPNPYWPSGHSLRGAIGGTISSCIGCGSYLAFWSNSPLPVEVFTFAVTVALFALIGSKMNAYSDS